MSVEEAMILRARPRIMASRRAYWIQSEVQKGCQPNFHAWPVRLEPAFEPILTARRYSTADEVVFEDPFPSSKLRRLRLWITPTQVCDWVRAETFLKQLSQLNRRLVFEISGNREGITLGLLAHKDDVPAISILFRAQYEECEIEIDADPLMRQVHGKGRRKIVFREYFPSPPYSHQLSSFEEFKRSPFISFMQALFELAPDRLGFYQCLFQPVDPTHDWHGNVETLLDIEFEIKLQSSPSLSRQSLQQAPSGSLFSMSRDVEVKAHNNRPFFVCVCRVGVAAEGEVVKGDVTRIAAFMHGFQHGGKVLRCVDSDSLEPWVNPGRWPAMLRKGLSYRPGFLVNSRELAGLVHPFVCDLVESRRIAFTWMEKLSVREVSLTSGTCVGVTHHAGMQQKVCIPDRLRSCSTHIIAKPGMGKSTVMLNMIAQDLERGHGLALFDAHGDTVKKVMELVPPEQYERCVYFNPGDPDWVPLWNPMASAEGDDIYRRADDLIGSFRQVFSDWGDRLEHVIRNGLIGLMSSGVGHFQDLYSLTRQGSAEFSSIKARMMPSIKDASVRQFWMHDFLKDYRRFEVQSPKHKLSKLIVSGHASRMFSQYENRIDLKAIMDQGHILLVDLSEMGSEMAQLLGAFMLSLIFTTATRRSNMPENQRKGFSVFVDEAHLFVGSAGLERLIVEARKFGVNLCLAHQHLSQFQTRKIDAIASVASTLIGRINKSDSRFMADQLQGLVEPKDLIGLEPYEMIGSIGNEVVRFQTLAPPMPHPQSDVSKLIEASRATYYGHAHQIQKANHSHQPEPSGNWYGDLEEWPHKPEDLAYDTTL